MIFSLVILLLVTLLFFPESDFVVTFLTSQNISTDMIVDGDVVLENNVTLTCPECNVRTGKTIRESHINMHGNFM